MITFNNIVQEIALKCVYFTFVKQYESCRSISIRAEVAFFMKQIDLKVLISND